MPLEVNSLRAGQHGAPKRKSSGLSPEPLLAYAVGFGAQSVDALMTKYPLACGVSPLAVVAVDSPHTSLEVVAAAASHDFASSQIVSTMFFHFHLPLFHFLNIL